MTKILRITAKRDGYRRCGVAHPGAATDHEIDAFDAKQIETLKQDSMLIVQELDAGAAADTADAKDEIDRRRAHAANELKEAVEDRKKAAEELDAAKADRAKAADELATAERVRKGAEAAVAKESETATKDAKPKGGKKS